ncbi:MAG: hypothetical protein ACOX2K_08775 [Bacillota bacterium]|jgi:hypothetical protein
MVKRGLWWLAIGSLTVAAAALYLHYAYFFSPFTFVQSAVTHLPWQWYRNPLQVEYAVLEEDGWRILTIEDRAEIDLLFSELQAGLGAVDAATLSVEGKPIWFGVRRQKDGAILLSVNGCEQGTACQVAENTYVALTERLQQLLSQRLQQARGGPTSQPLAVDGS